MVTPRIESSIDASVLFKTTAFHNDGEVEIRRFKCVPTWEALVKHLRRFYRVEIINFYIQYLDEEDDLVRISSTLELVDCCKRLGSPMMRLYVRPMVAMEQPLARVKQHREERKHQRKQMDRHGAQVRANNKTQAKMARVQRKIQSLGFYHLPASTSALPPRVTHLMMDGNNMLYVTLVSRQLVRAKQVAKAEAALAHMVFRGAVKLKLHHATLVFDRCTHSFTKAIGGDGGVEGTFDVTGAGPLFQTADDFIIQWALDHKEFVASTMFVTCDRGLVRRTLHLDRGAIIVRPQEFLVFLTGLLEEDVESEL